MKVRAVRIDSAAEAAALIEKVGADPYAVRLMPAKAVFRALLAEDVDNRAANILKQEMLSLGGEAAVARKVSGFVRGRSPVLLLGTLRHYERLTEKLARQPFGLNALAAQIRTVLAPGGAPVFEVPLGKKTLTFDPALPVVMGILNVTPDSFSDGGRYAAPSVAVARAGEMVAAGAGIIDIGGESTRPGAQPVPLKEELRRVVPVVEALAARGMTVSVDTFKPEVAEAALAAGARIINDITGLRYKKGAMADVAARRKAPVILMHMQGTPRTMQKAPSYRDPVADIIAFFEKRIASAAERGLDPSLVILDPGIGFGKTMEHNLEILGRLGEFASLGRPVAIGTSRKAFIGRIEGGTPPGERTAGSVASVLAAAAEGAHLFRVHDVAETVRALKVFNAIRSRGASLR